MITEIVDKASTILSSSDPVESKIIKLNDIAENNVDIDGIGLYTLGKYRKIISEDERIKYKKLFKSYFLKSFSSRLVDYSDPKINVVAEKNGNQIGGTTTDFDGNYTIKPLEPGNYTVKANFAL